MTNAPASSPVRAAERDAQHPSLGELLVRSAVGLRNRTAVRALVEEAELLARDDVRAALVAKQDGVMTCRWEGLTGRLHSLGLDDCERAFLGLVLSMAGLRKSHLHSVEHLDDRRLKIVLQAVMRLARNDWIAIGTRL
ncbi:hypothetical protein [Streptomyces sp. NPDC001381]|uniref:hypothetical protein n=1 Tax=Streptomyces sp. NPDC001381 TaxID=3364567 RepID=UPI0036812244